MSDPYLYPGTRVLRNKLGIRNGAELDRVERLLVTDRIIEGAPNGRFDLDHLRSIHLHLFQDIYDWAGELRTIPLSKSGQSFQAPQFIRIGMADVHRRIVEQRHFHGMDHVRAAHALGRTIGDVNYVHPFREGNGRTQLQFARQLTQKVGYTLDITRLDGREWVQASREANEARYDPMVQCFAKALRASNDQP